MSFDPARLKTDPAAAASVSDGSRGWRRLAMGPLAALIALAILRVLVGVVLERAGILAVSDDDYARVTIAERFATMPRLDPTQTSWLPFPFWWMGGVMRIFGPSLATARACAEVAAVSASWLMFAGGRAMGMSVGAALAGSALATVLPAAAVLGCAPIPELLTAALCSFALLAIGSRARTSAEPNVRDARSRLGWDLWAALAVLAASLSRYEAWPIAFVVAMTLLLRRLTPASIALALVAISGPLLWIVHNRLAHGDALHFLRRVAAYRAALGGPGTAGRDMVSYLVALTTAAPGLAAAIVLLVVIGPKRLRLPMRLKPTPVAAAAPASTADAAEFTPSTGTWAPAAIGAVALILFLLIGAWLGGVPTHHPGRTLLLVWLLGCMVSADRVATLAHPWAWTCTGLLTLILALQFPQELEGGLDRRAEIAIGHSMRGIVRRDERALVATDDYGYFAIIAAFGRPIDASIDRTHDPRRGVEASALTNTQRIRDKLSREGASWLVVPARVVIEGLERTANNDAFALFRLPAAR